ncbi:MAG TPA: DUF362 domain-containing protein [Fuerstia sp.]|nr:DUF362 domain-containing protein [Fuerstiella sp.]
MESVGAILGPGNTVVIKPNFVIDQHYAGGDIYLVVTHPSVIRAVADYCLIAVQQHGQIIVADAPVEDCDFDNLIDTMKLKVVQAAYRNRLGVNLDVLDLRRYVAKVGDGNVYSFNRTPLGGDPAGDVVVDLGEQSMLYGKPGEFFGADPDTSETQRNHRGSTHRYQVSSTILSCDALISVPKLKVHKKVGATLNLKGMVGMNTNKNFLVHYTLGTPAKGGDQAVDPVVIADSIILKIRKIINAVFVSSHNRYLERLHNTLFHSRLYVRCRNLLRKMGLELSDETDRTDGGNWHGNDTCWRMVADLAKLMCYADNEGTLHETPQRAMFCVVDGIIGGDGNGPMRPDARPHYFRIQSTGR